MNTQQRTPVRPLWLTLAGLMLTLLPIAVLITRFALQGPHLFDGLSLLTVISLVAGLAILHTGTEMGEGE